MTSEVFFALFCKILYSAINLFVGLPIGAKNDK